MAIDLEKAIQERETGFKFANTREKPMEYNTQLITKSHYNTEQKSERNEQTSTWDPHERIREKEKEKDVGISATVKRSRHTKPKVEVCL